MSIAGKSLRSKPAKSTLQVAAVILLIVTAFYIVALLHVRQYATVSLHNTHYSHTASYGQSRTSIGLHMPPAYNSIM